MSTNDHKPELLESSLTGNKFQSFFHDDQSSLYSPQERLNKTHVLSLSFIQNSFNSALDSGAKHHYELRKKAVAERTSEDDIERTVETLFDSHFRKQIRLGPSKEQIGFTVQEAHHEKKPLTLIGLMFTRKNICPLKRSGGDESDIDLAEILSFIHLNNFARLVATYYPYGVKFMILSEGRRFLKTFNLCEPIVRLYQQRLHKIIEDYHLDHLQVVDYEDFMEQNLDLKQKQLRQDGYKTMYQKYMQSFLPLINFEDMHATCQEAIEKDFVKDIRNKRNNFIPLWDSIKHSIPYPELKKEALDHKVDFEQFYKGFFEHIFLKFRDPTLEALRRVVITRSWLAAIEHNAQWQGDMHAKILPEQIVGIGAIRTTINPKPNSPYIGILTVRETTRRVQPWHGMAYLDTNGVGTVTYTALSKLEIESRKGIPVSIDHPSDKLFFYASSDALASMRESSFKFSFQTR